MYVSIWVRGCQKEGVMLTGLTNHFNLRVSGESACFPPNLSNFPVCPEILWDPSSKTKSSREMCQITANQQRNLPALPGVGTSANPKFKQRTTMKSYPWWYCVFALFGLQPILSVCGATRTLCGRQGIYRSVGRAATVRLNCKQVLLRESEADPRTAHPKASDSSPSNGQEQTPQQLHDESPINPPRPKLWISLRKPGCRWLERSLLQHILSRQPKQQEGCPPPSLPLLPPSFTSNFKEDLQGGRKHSEAAAFCPRVLLHEGEPVFCLRENTVSPLRL